MSQVYLEIGDLPSLIEFVQEAKEKTGLLKDISTKKLEVLLSEKEFPIRVPVDLDSVIGLAANPMVKKIFGKRIEETTLRTLLKAIEN